MKKKNQLDHAVLVTGYGTDNSTGLDFYLGEELAGGLNVSTSLIPSEHGTFRIIRASRASGKSLIHPVASSLCLLYVIPCSLF